MRWRVEVVGHEFDLAELEVAVPGLGASAFRDGDKTLLYAENFERMGTAEEVHLTAERLISSVNAALRLSNPGAKPITLGAIVNADGTQANLMSMQVVEVADRVRAVVVIRNGDALCEPTPPTRASEAHPPDLGTGR